MNNGERAEYGFYGLRLPKTALTAVLAIFLVFAALIFSSCSKTVSANSGVILTGIPDEPITQPAGLPVEDPAADTETSAAQTQADKPDETAAAAETEAVQPEAAAEIIQPGSDTETASPVVPVKLYTEIPAFWNEKLETVEGYLSGVGIEYTVEQQYSTVEAGLVSEIVYYGYADEAGYHLRVGKPVVLRVSIGPEPEAMRSVENYTDDSVIYLTFDDGPSKNVDKVLEILAKYDIKATFFLVGNFVTWRSADVRKIYDAGHVIGCHSMTHDIKTMYVTAQAFEDEIDMWESAMKNAVGDDFQSNVFRFPGGSNANRVTKSGLIENFRKILAARGYNAFDWTFADNDKYPSGRGDGESNADYLLRSSKETLVTAEKRAGVPKIMLMHDTEDDTVAMLGEIIEYFIARGYSFDTLDRLDGSVLF